MLEYHSMIPEKENFSFQEVASITDVRPYVLRFWESEFEQIDPVTNSDGSKIYSQSDIESIFRIKELLYEDKNSIPMAKIKMDQECRKQEEISAEPERESSELRGDQSEMTFSEESEEVPSEKSPRNRNRDIQISPASSAEIASTIDYQVLVELRGKLAHVYERVQSLKKLVRTYSERF